MDTQLVMEQFLKYEEMLNERTIAVLGRFFPPGVEPLSPVTGKYMLVNRPSCIVGAIAVYLVVVSLGLLRHKLGSASQKPMSTVFKSLTIIHNLFLVLLSTHMFTGVLYQAWKNGYSIWGNAYSPSETEMAEVIFTFFWSKIYEFLDTMIMLYKGNVKQVSFLHVYHHATISFIWWMIAYNAPGGDAYFSAAQNSFVHIVMYAYYLVAALIGKDEKMKKKYLWWGKHLTQMQMAQFFFNFVQVRPRTV